MRRRKGIALLVFSLFLIISFLFLLYWKWGGKYYYEALRVLARTPQDKKAQSEQIFNSAGKYQYSGIYMGSFMKLIPGVWVWGNSGPRFFRSDEYTVYSYFQMCTPDMLEKIDKGGSVSPGRTIDTDLGVWAGKARTGDFITIKIAGPLNGGNLGRLREAIAHDWWVFDSASFLRDICER